MSYLPRSIAAVPRDSIIDPPTVAGPDDDEFTSFSANWSLYTDVTPVTTAYTNVGAIDLSILPGGVAANTFRASVIGSTLWLQLPSNTSVIMVKNVSAAITQRRMWFARVSMGGAIAGGVDNPRFRLSLMKQTSGKPDRTNRIYAGYNTDQGHLGSVIAGVNQTTILTPVAAGLQHWVDGVGMVVAHNVSGTAHSGFLWRVNGAYAVIGGMNAVAFNAATDYIGFHFHTNTGLSTLEPAPATAANNIVGVHFLRSVPWPGWIANS